VREPRLLPTDIEPRLLPPVGDVMGSSEPRLLPLLIGGIHVRAGLRVRVKVRVSSTPVE